MLSIRSVHETLLKAERRPVRVRGLLSELPTTLCELEQ